MNVEQVRPGVFQLTLHAYELAPIIAAARWVAEGSEGEIPDEAREQIQAVLARYDRQRERSAEKAP